VIFIVAYLGNLVLIFYQPSKITGQLNNLSTGLFTIFVQYKFDPIAKATDNMGYRPAKNRYKRPMARHKKEGQPPNVPSQTGGSTGCA
jgi:hypothetical protein